MVGRYQNKWVECMQELMEQVQIEYLPVDAKENGQHFEPGRLIFSCNYLYGYKYNSSYNQSYHYNYKYNIL